MSDFAISNAFSLDTANFPLEARATLRLLERLNHGQLAVTFPDGQRAAFGWHDGSERADFQLHNWNVVKAALHNGDIGFAESWIAGDWSTSDLPRLMTLLVRNRNSIDDAVYGSVSGRLLHRLRHWLNRNTRTQSKRNIHAHYDLGNEFYAVWLGDSMTYSSALFDSVARAPEDADLERGHAAKYTRVLEQLQLKPGARLLEIGCGWGGFAVTAARAGHAVTGLTLSKRQLDHARQLLAGAGLPGDLRWQDYRDEYHQYDGIASIEMFEAVGEAYWPSYFATLKRCLAPGGRACVQTITIDDALFDRYRAGSDFIQQYIFPGGMLPSPSAFRMHAERAGLAIVDELRFGSDYAHTLRLWRQRFLAQLPAVRALGFDERFIRTWNFYLAYCEAAFVGGNTDVMHFTLVAR